MADIQSNIKVNIDTSSALSSIKNLQAQISAFHTSMARGSAEAATASSQFQQKLINSVNATGKFAAEIKNIKTTTETFTTALEKNKLSMGEYFRYAGGASKSFGRLFTSEFNTIEKVARERVKSLQTQYIQLGRDANGAMRAISIRPLMLDLDNLQTKTAIAAQKQQILNQLLKQGSTNLLNFGKNTQWAGRQLMVGFTIPLMIAGTTAAKSYMQIEQAALKLQRVYGDLNTSVAETKQMVKQVQELATAYTQYGVAVADTMDMAAKAAAMGKTGAELLAQVNNATKLSVLGGVDQSTALETTISLTNAFGLSTDQLTTKINFLNAVENQTVLSIEDMTTAIPKAAPVIKQLGGNVEDLAFFLTAMKEGGINASEGANAIKSGLSALINPSKKASDFLMGFGVNVKGIVEKDKGNLKKTVLDFATALNTLDPLNRARAIEQMFGKFQFARISTLMQNITKEGSQASKAFGLASMSSIQLAAISRKELEKVSSSPMYKFQKAIADFQLKMAPIGEAFLKAVTPIINFASDMLKGFNNIGDGAKQFSVVAIAAIAGLGPILLMTFGLMANGVANIVKLFANIKSFFNRTTSASKVLGESVSYMTEQEIQAAAVAASLDQVHSKLTQTFTSEAGSVDALTAAMMRAVEAQNLFHGITPTARPGVAKMATGGMVVGPGGPKDDAVPTNLSNGEAVIDAATVKKNPGIIAALFAGKKIRVPGLSTGGMIARAHTAMPFEQGSSQWNAGVKIAGLESLAMEFPQFIKVVSNLVAELPQKLNIGLIKGVSQQTFSSGWNSRENKMVSSAKIGGLDVSNTENLAAVKELEQKIHDRTIAIAKGTENQKVTDEILAKATRDVIDQTMKEKGAIGDASRALDAASKQIGQVRVQVPTADIRSNLDSGKFNKNSNGKVFYGDIEVARESQSKPGKFRPASSYNPTKSYTRIPLQSISIIGENAASDITKTIISGAKKKAKIQSPSKETMKVGEDLSQGAINGIKDGIPKAKVVGQNLAESILKETSQSGARMSRRVTSAQTNYDLVGLPTYGPAAPTIGQKLQSKAQGFINSATSAKVGDLSSAKLAGLGMAASVASLALSGLPGPIGQIAGTITPLLSIFSMISPLLVTFGASLGIAELPLLPIALGLGALAAVIGITVAISNSINDAKKKELAQINSTSTAAKAAAGALNELAKLSGGSGNDAGGTQSAAASKGMKTKTLTDAQILEKTNEFNDPKSDAGKLIASLKAVKSDQDRKSILTTIARNLVGAGLTPDAAAANVEAIQNRANLGTKRKSIVINPKQFTANSLTAQKAIGNENTSSLSVIKMEQNKFGRAKAIIQDSLAKSLTKSKDISPEALSKALTTVTNAAKKGNKEFKAYNNAVTTFAINTQQNMKAVGNQFLTGVISLKNYKDSIAQIKNSFNDLGAAGKADVLKGMRDSLAQTDGPTAEIAATIKDAALQLQFLQLAAAGGTKAIGPEILAKMQAGGKAGQDAFNAAAAKYLGGAQASYKKENPAGDQQGSGGGNAPTDLLAQVKTGIASNRITNTLGKSGLNKDFISMLATADSATQKVYMTFKNGIPILNAHGKALLKAFDVKTISDYITQQIQAAKDARAEVTTRNKLVKAGIDYKDAVEAAKDQTLQAALATAKTKTQTDKIIKAWQDVKKATEAALTPQENFQKAADQADAYLSAKKNEIESNFNLNSTNVANKAIIENAQNAIAAKQYEQDKFNAGLQNIANQEDAINKTYDERIKALDTIQKANDVISSQQKGQLTLADALSQGDISAAARVVQDMRAQNATNSLSTQKDLLDQSRQSELAGLTATVNDQKLTRLQIEEQIKQIGQDIAQIENDRLKPAQEAIRLAEIQKQADLDIYDNQQLQWDALKNKIDLAATSAQQYADILKKAQELSSIIVPSAPSAPSAFVPGVNNGYGPLPGDSNFDKTGNVQNMSVDDALKRAQAIKAIDAKNNIQNMSIADAMARTTIFKSNGGLITPKYFASGGFAKGSDTIPAMLTPGEFVISKNAVAGIGVAKLSSINNGTFDSGSVYNYNLSVNLSGSDLDANDVAKTVMAQIRQIESQGIRSNRF